MFLKMISILWAMCSYLILICFLVLLVLSSRISPIQESSKRDYRNHLKDLVLFWMGLSVAFFVKYSFTSPPSSTLRISTGNWSYTPNLAFVVKGTHKFKGIKPVIFITTTDYSVIAPAVLTRLAQSLYPARHLVQWIVVSLPIESSQGYLDLVHEGNGRSSTFGETILKHTELIEDHRRRLHKLLNRFGVPYILLDSNSSTLQNLQNSGTYGWLSSSSPYLDRTDKGYYIGLLWVLKYLKNGIIFMGEEQYTYSAELFFEISKVKRAATWQIGLPQGLNMTARNLIMQVSDDPPNDLFLAGWSEGSKSQIGSIPIERGGFAFDIHHLWNHIPPEDYWKLCLHGKILNQDLRVDLADIEILGDNKEGSQYDDSKVLVWRTKTKPLPWPKSISADSKIEKLVNGNSSLNIQRLLKNVFGPRFQLMKNFVRKNKNQRKFNDYHLSKILKELM